LHDFIDGRAGEPASDQSPFKGEIASEPANGLVDVLVPALHPAKPYRAPYTPHPGPVEPEVGDVALILFDDDGDPWVVSWRAAD
jgi:hypothetical protein